MKTSNEIINYIKDNTGVDLNQYRDDTTRRFDREKSRKSERCFCVDWKSIPKTDQRKIELLENQYGKQVFSMDEMGAWMKRISYIPA